MAAHLFRHLRDNRVKAFFFVVEESLLGQRQSFVSTANTDQVLHDVRDRLAREPVKRRAKIRLQTPFGMQQRKKKTMERTQEHVSMPQRPVPAAAGLAPDVTGSAARYRSALMPGRKK